VTVCPEATLAGAIATAKRITVANNSLPNNESDLICMGVREFLCYGQFLVNPGGTGLYQGAASKPTLSEAEKRQKRRKTFRV